MFISVDLKKEFSETNGYAVDDIELASISIPSSAVKEKNENSSYLFR